MPVIFPNENLENDDAYYYIFAGNNSLELEMERDKREREAWERQMRDIRELEFMEKMKQEMDLKLPG